MSEGLRAVTLVELGPTPPYVRLTHEHALEMCGATLVEVDTLADYESAFTPRTAMAFFFNAAEEGRITHDEWLRVGHEHGVPCFLDAAADVPPIANR